jgi:transcriptional regulator with XRE-family HTH domain
MQVCRYGRRVEPAPLDTPPEPSFERITAVAESAALRRRLTAELRRLRSQAKMTQRQVADRLDWSPSKVIRIEQGAVRIGVTDLEALLRLYDISDQHTIGELTTMAKESKKLPFSEYRDFVSAEGVRYFQYESNASIIRQVHPLLVPGLLQSEEYSRALLESWGTPKDRIDKLVESRKERQELFERPDPTEAFFVLDEAVLRRQVGGPKVMARQIDHLVTMAGRPDVSIQVLPFSIGAHSALAGPFVHLEFPAEDDPEVIFVENTLGDTLFRDDPEITAQYREQFWALEDAATSPESFEKVARSTET